MSRALTDTITEVSTRSAAASRAPQQERSRVTREKLLASAVDELLASGYAGLTTDSVARRAGVSRGAHQGHFPHKRQLVLEAVGQLANRQAEELLRGAATRRGRKGMEATLDLMFEQYSGPLFAATLELALAARHDPDLRPAVRQGERVVADALHEVGVATLSVNGVPADDIGRRWTLAVGAVRGIATLRLLDWPSDVVDKRWRDARADLTESLLRPR